MTLILAVAVQELALGWQGWGVLRPDLVLICLFYWRLYRPDRCGMGWAFITGLMVDVMTRLPLGLTAFTQILVILLITRFANRLRVAHFLFLVLVMGVAVLLEQGFQWAIMSLLQGPDARWALFWGRGVATALWAGPVVAGLIWIHRLWVENA
ncbi:MAG: rod shape-determining protein MreD [Magnetococcales bacterium]|nr:rod shape-determining protein MreD [Magnetococcales bacterium]